MKSNITGCPVQSDVLSGDTLCNILDFFFLSNFHWLVCLLCFTLLYVLYFHVRLFFSDLTHQLICFWFCVSYFQGLCIRNLFTVFYFFLALKIFYTSFFNSCFCVCVCKCSSHINFLLACGFLFKLYSPLPRFSLSTKFIVIFFSLFQISRL